MSKAILLPGLHLERHPEATTGAQSTMIQSRQLESRLNMSVIMFLKDVTVDPWLRTKYND